jgi:enolase-phosphatase E1
MIEIKNLNAIVTDIEGTTSSLSFVKDVLFPYARERIPAYVESHKTKIADLLNEVRVLENNSKLTAEELVPIFLRWMDEDKKITPLKTLQGLIWKAGYDAGELQGHIYDDALTALQAWHDQGLRLYIYSSGSVAAQKLLFCNTAQGDLTPLFSGYFDTTTGPKVEAFSYRKIAADIGQNPANILFLSDIQAEIDAAMEAGFQTIIIDRDGKNKNAVGKFHEIVLQEKAA